MIDDNIIPPPSQVAATVAVFITFVIILMTTTIMIASLRHHHHLAQARWWSLESAKEEDKPTRTLNAVGTPATKLGTVVVAVTNDDTTTIATISKQMQLKVDFLSRYKAEYGYVHSKKGYIDNWRLEEFPSLISPLELPLTTTLDRQQREEVQSSSLLKHGDQWNYHDNTDDDDRDRRKMEPINIFSTDTNAEEIDSTDATEREVYLDYAGSALPTKSLLHRIYMSEQQHYQILANPHSLGGGKASDRTIKLMRKAEECVMRHFGIVDNCREETSGGDVTLSHPDGGAEEDDADAITYNPSSFNPGYQVVFTSGATDSLRLVAERFPWSYAIYNGAAPLYSSSCSSAMSTSSQELRMTLIDNGDHDVASNGVVIDNASSPKRVKSIRLSSVLLYPHNVHTSVIGMRQIAMQHGGQFHCVSVEELLSATTEWFQNLLRRSISYDYCKAEEEEENEYERIAEDMTHFTTVVGNNDNATVSKGPIPCKTIWLHHLLVLPLECNFSGERFNWNNTTAMARKSCVTSYYLHWSNNMKTDQDEKKQCNTIKICHKWHILLDTAKAAATSPLHLPTLVHGGGPDFAVVSFYKLFGAPSGLGALFMKRHNRRKRPTTGTVTGNRKAESMNTPVNTSVGVAVNGITSKKLVIRGMQFYRSCSPRHYFGGGSVDVVLPEIDFVASRNAYVTPSTCYQSMHDDVLDEDEHVDLGVLIHGTEHFRGIANLIHGFQEIDEYGGMEKVRYRYHNYQIFIMPYLVDATVVLLPFQISMHSTCLAAELVRRFAKVLHQNGNPVVEVYGWKSAATNSWEFDYGPTVAFNILSNDGSPVGCDEVSKLATISSPPIQLRTGCFCNPGACQSAIQLSNTDVLNNYWFGNVVCGDQRGIVNGKPTGAIRASFGKDSTWEDMDALVRFVAKVFGSRSDESLLLQSPSAVSSALYQSKTMTIDSLFLFPIKSCAAMRVTRWPVSQLD